MLTVRNVAQSNIDNLHDKYFNFEIRMLTYTLGIHVSLLFIYHTQIIDPKKLMWSR